MRKEKTVWTREYTPNGKLTSSGSYAIRRNLYPFGQKQYRTYYSVSASPLRTSWYRYFFDFNSASKFARNLVSHRRYRK